MKFSEYLTDPVLEEEGVWARLRRGNGEVLVARAGNPKHEELVRKLRRKHARGRRGDELPREIEEEIAIEAMTRTILLDWRGFENEDGSEDVYSTDKARQYLKQSRDFRLEVAEISTEMEMYRREEVESAKGNSKKSSAGGGSTGS
jgi:hypothetical protein